MVPGTAGGESGRRATRGGGGPYDLGMSRRVALVVLCLAALAATAAGAHQLTWRAWTTDDGLPQDFIYDLVQTGDGYLWIATLNGLARFDGVQMTLFDRAQYPDMGSSRCFTLTAARSGALWIGTEEGVVRYEHGVFRAWGAAEGVHAPVRSILELEDGTILLSDAGGIEKRDGARWVAGPVTPPAGFNNSADGFRWWRQDVRGDEVRLLEDDGRWYSYTLPPAALAPHGGVSHGDSGPHWIMVGREVWQLRRGTITRAPGPQGDGIATLVPGPTGLWAYRPDGLHVRDRRGWTSFPPFARALPRAFALLADREGCLWIGGDGGLVQVRATPVRMLDVAPDRERQNLYVLAQDGAGRVWAGSQGRGLACVDGRCGTPRTADGGPCPAFTAALPEADGTVLLGTDGGLLYRGAGEVVTRLHAFGPGAVMALARDRNGRLWAGCENALWREENGVWTAVWPRDGSPGADVRVLLGTRDGAMWAGTRGGLVRIAGTDVRRWTVRNGLSSDSVRALHEDGSGRLWIGTYDGGLLLYAQDRFVALRRKHGLFDDGVFTILDDGAGRIWMSSNRGIHSVSTAAVEEFVAGRAATVSSRAFTKQDGMRSSECNGGHQPAAFRHRDGTLWFSTQEGAAIVDPREAEAESAAPRVLVESAVTGARPLDLAGAVTLEPHERALEVRYTATTLVRAEQVRFRTRLAPLESEWSDAGTKRLVHYSALPPGEFVLHVAAAAPGGAFPAEGAALRIVVRPHTWETAWFRGALALSVAGLLYAGYRRRIGRLKRRRAEQDAFARRLIESQEAERKRIAGELHDGIGQTLVVIRNRALMGLRPGLDEAARVRQMSVISEEASTGIDDVRKIAYNLRPYQLDRLGLTRALEAIVEQARAAAGIEIVAEIAPLEGVFAHGDEINVYRIVQESVSNLVKHASARSGRVAVRVDDGVVEIAVEDDGRGFDPDRPPPGPGGAGLGGIAERVHLLGGRHAIRSSPGEGTRVTIQLPRSGGAA